MIIYPFPFYVKYLHVSDERWKNEEFVNHFFNELQKEGCRFESNYKNGKVRLDNFCTKNTRNKLNISIEIDPYSNDRIIVKGQLELSLVVTYLISCLFLLVQIYHSLENLVLLLIFIGMLNLIQAYVFFYLFKKPLNTFRSVIFSKI